VSVVCCGDGGSGGGGVAIWRGLIGALLWASEASIENDGFVPVGENPVREVKANRAGKNQFL